MKNRIIYFSLSAIYFLTFAILGFGTGSGQQALVPGVDYVQGEVIIRISPAYMPSKSEVSILPPSLGITELDSIFELFGCYKLRKLTPCYNKYNFDAGRNLERTFILYYRNDIDAQDLVTILSQFPVRLRTNQDFIELKTRDIFHCHFTA